MAQNATQSHQAAAKMLRADLSVSDRDGKTPLHYAAERAMPIACQELVANGAPLNAVDAFECTALHYAAPHKRGKDTVKFLVGAGSSVEAINAKKEGVLHCAAYCANQETLGYVLDGCNPNRNTVNERDARGRTPLHVVAEQGSVPCVNLLIKFGANVNLREDDRDFTPLAMALSKGYDSVAEVCTWVLLSHASVIRLQSHFATRTSCFFVSLFCA